METIPEGRLSKNHRAVYDVVREQGQGRHLSMAALFELAKVKRPAIGFTTVYRALTRLRDQGLVAEVTLPGADSAYFELAAPPHAHFRCSVCGGVDDVPFVLPETVVAGLAGQLHAEVSGATVTLEGRCVNCTTR
jgi:Fe2+ or Zn2+ uptake regulation protein